MGLFKLIFNLKASYDYLKRFEGGVFNLLNNNVGWLDFKTQSSYIS